MQHGKKNVKLGRTQAHRDALLANLATSLFIHEKIMTTSPKAKALRPLVDRLISTAKQDTLAAKRRVARTIRDKEAFKKIFAEIVPKLVERNSGYSRVIKAGFRKGDGAEMSVVELLIERPIEEVQRKEGRLKRLAGKVKGKSGKSKAVKSEKPEQEASATSEPEETAGTETEKESASTTDSEKSKEGEE